MLQYLLFMIIDTVKIEKPAAKGVTSADIAEAMKKSGKTGSSGDMPAWPDPIGKLPFVPKFVNFCIFLLKIIKLFMESCRYILM